MWFRSLLPARAPGPSSRGPVAVAPLERGLETMDSRFDAEPATQRSVGATLPGDLRDSDRPPGAETPEPSRPAEASDFPQPGDVIGDTYLVVSEIGRGSMGIVLSAFDQKLERTVAIKLVRAELLDDGFRQRFLHEARVMAQINHPNVVCIHALGEYRSHPYFVMELVEGTNLEQWQRQAAAAVPIELALEILSDVCLGVSAIHAAGAVHRDLKPSNILLDWHLRSRVADFGVSTRTVGSERSGAVGTPGYMPPEVVLCSDAGTPPLPRSDVYSLACIAYELLTGTHPYRRAGTPLHTLVPPLTDAVPLPSVVRPELGTAFDRVLLQGLEWDVSQRTPSVEAFRSGLLDARRHGNNPDRIVVAEDDRDFRELIGLRLQREFPGADIECVADGVEALEALERKPASVALIDLQMPAMDGVALTAQLRSRDDCASMPIIVLTASGGAREWQRLSLLGADRFLVKPLQLDDMVTVIRQAVLERRKPISSSAAPQH